MPRSLIPPVVTEGARLTELRLEVREFLRRAIADGRFVPRVDSWISGWDADFSRELGRRGWLGMTIPHASTAAMAARISTATS